MSEFSLEQYLSNGVENIVKNALRATASNPRESLFMMRFAKQSQRAAKIRREAEAQGEHIPPFLISSITSSCNLHCKGCYSRANHACHDEAVTDQLSAEEWENVFTQAEQMGVSFILLAGGEPLVRMDVIERAATQKNILFPVFSNGTLFNHQYQELFDKNRNLLPVLSIEGDESDTDGRRGSGTYEKVHRAMLEMKKKGIYFGASITVTTENINEVLSDDFAKKIQMEGCKVIFYVEYVPVSKGSEKLAPGDTERAFMQKKIMQLREKQDKMLFIAFPGDEKSSGGCLAAGRGFFHINSHGGAEPCPFSPYSDTNIRKIPLRAALQSPLFRRLQSEHVMEDSHVGGCVLYEKAAMVEALAATEEC